MLRHNRVFPPGFFFVLTMGLGLFALMVSSVPGCAHNPVAAAQTLQQKSYAVYGEFVIFEEHGAALISDPSVPGEVKIAIRAADARAKPAVDALLAATQQYETVATALKAGTTTADKLSIVATNLSAWVQEASAETQALVSAVKSAPAH